MRYLEDHHTARGFRRQLADRFAHAPQFAVLSDSRLDDICAEPRYADHHDVWDMVGEITYHRTRRKPLPVAPPPRTTEDVRASPQAGDYITLGSAGGGVRFAEALTGAVDGYVMVRVNTGPGTDSTLAWTLKWWGFQGVPGDDRYVHHPAPDAPPADDRPRTKGPLGQRSDAHKAWQAYKDGRKAIRRRRHDKESAHERVLRFALGRNDADYITEALNRADRGVYAGPPHTNRNYRHPAPYTPETYDGPTAVGDEAPGVLGAVWPGAR